jgi:hypothetical protein
MRRRQRDISEGNYLYRTWFTLALPKQGHIIQEVHNLVATGIHVAYQ